MVERRDASIKDLEELNTQSNPRRFLRQKIAEMTGALNRMAEINESLGWDCGLSSQPMPRLAHDVIMFSDPKRLPPLPWAQEEHHTYMARELYREALDKLGPTPPEERPMIALTPESRKCAHPRCYQELLPGETVCRLCGLDQQSPIRPVSTQVRYPRAKPRTLFLPEEFGDTETEIERASESIRTLEKEVWQRQKKNDQLMNQIQRLRVDRAEDSAEGAWGGAPADELDVPQTESQRKELILLEGALERGREEEKMIRLKLSRMIEEKKDTEGRLERSLQPYDEPYKTEFSPPPKTLEQKTNEICDSMDAAVGELVALDESLMSQESSVAWTTPGCPPESPSALDDSIVGNVSSESGFSTTAWHGSPPEPELDNSLGLLPEEMLRSPGHLLPLTRARPLVDTLEEEAEQRMMREDSVSAFDDIQLGLLWDRLVETLQFTEGAIGAQNRSVAGLITEMAEGLMKEGEMMLDDSKVAQLWNRLVEPDRASPEGAVGAQDRSVAGLITEMSEGMMKEGEMMLDDSKVAQIWNRLVGPDRASPSVAGLITEMAEGMMKEGEVMLDDSKVAQIWNRLVGPDRASPEGAVGGQATEEPSVREELNRMNQELDTIEEMLDGLLPYQTYFEDIGPVATDEELFEFQVSRVPQSIERKLQTRTRSPSPPTRHLPHGIRRLPSTLQPSPPLPRLRVSRARQRRAALPDETPKRAPTRKDFRRMTRALQLTPGTPVAGASAQQQPRRATSPVTGTPVAGASGQQPRRATSPVTGTPVPGPSGLQQLSRATSPVTGAPVTGPTSLQQVRREDSQRSRSPFPRQPSLRLQLLRRLASASAGTPVTRPQPAALPTVSPAVAPPDAAKPVPDYARHFIIPSLPPLPRSESPPGARYPMHPAYERGHYIQNFYDTPKSLSPQQLATPRRTATPPCEPTPPRRTSTPPRQITLPGRTPTPPRQTTPPRRPPTPPRQRTPPRRTPTPPRQTTPPRRTPTPPRQTTPPRRMPTPPRQTTPPRRTPTPPRQTTPPRRTPSPKESPPPGARYPLHPAYDRDVPIPMRRRCPHPPEWPAPIPVYNLPKIPPPSPPKQRSPPRDVTPSTTPPRQLISPREVTPPSWLPGPVSSPSPSPELSPPLPPVIPKRPRRPVGRYKPYRAQPPASYPDVAEIDESGEPGRAPGAVWRELFNRPENRRFFGFRESDIAMRSGAGQKRLLERSFKVIEKKLNDIRQQKDELKTQIRAVQSKGGSSPTFQMEKAMTRLNKELAEVKKKQSLLSKAVMDIEAEAMAKDTPLTRTPRYYSPARPVQFPQSDDDFMQRRLEKQETTAQRKNYVYTRAMELHKKGRLNWPDRRPLSQQSGERALLTLKDFTPPSLPPPVLPPPRTPSPPPPSPTPRRSPSPRYSLHELVERYQSRLKGPSQKPKRPTRLHYLPSFSARSRLDEFVRKMDLKEREKRKEWQEKEKKRKEIERERQIMEQERKIREAERKRQEEIDRQVNHQILLGEVKKLKSRAEDVKSGEFVKRLRSQSSTPTPTPEEIRQRQRKARQRKQEMELLEERKFQLKYEADMMSRSPNYEEFKRVLEQRVRDDDATEEEKILLQLMKNEHEVLTRAQKLEDEIKQRYPRGGPKPLQSATPGPSGQSTIDEDEYKEKKDQLKKVEDLAKNLDKIVRPRVKAMWHEHMRESARPSLRLQRLKKERPMKEIKRDVQMIKVEKKWKKKKEAEKRAEYLKEMENREILKEKKADEMRRTFKKAFAEKQRKRQGAATPTTTRTTSPVEKPPPFTVKKDDTKHDFKYRKWQEILYPRRDTTFPAVEEPVSPEQTRQGIERRPRSMFSPRTSPKPQDHRSLADIGDIHRLPQRVATEWPRSHPGDPHVMENYFYKMMEIFYDSDSTSTDDTWSEESDGFKTPPSDEEARMRPLPGREWEMDAAVARADDTTQSVQKWLDRCAM